MSPPPIPMAHGRASKYLDRHFNRQAMKILPGEFYATTEDEVIVTVLGSCVAACLYDAEVRVGGMNHFLLAEPEAPVSDEESRAFQARHGFWVDGWQRFGGAQAVLDQVRHPRGGRQHLGFRV